MRKPRDMKSLREKAKDKIRKDRNNVTFRSCWNCNEAHEHLKKSKLVINCGICGHWYYKGEDITEPDEV